MTQSATPAAVRRTTRRFIAPGPPPTTPRSPAVPKREGVVEALVERRGVAGVEQRLQLGARRSVGVLCDPLGDRARRARGRGRAAARHSRSMTPRSRRPRPGAAAAPAASTSRWSSGVGETPAARLVDEREPEHLGAEVPRGDRLERRRHPDEVRTHRAQHPDLGGRLVVRAAQRGVDALGQVGGDRSRASARSRGE